MYLLCDLGASSADWGLGDPKTGEITNSCDLPLSAESFPDMLENQVFSWIDRVRPDQQITATCIAVAGRVEDGEARLTNGERWQVRIDDIREILQARGHSPKIHLINDFEALSLGVAALLKEDVRPEAFQSVHGRFRLMSPGKRLLVCGPGTGLGVAFLQLDGIHADLPNVVSSEGGHHSLAPESIAQNKFLQYFGQFVAKVSYEDALSKEGLCNLYNYFRKTDHNLDQLFDMSPYDIVKRAGPNDDVAASDALSLFCEILANFCGNLALTFNIDRGIFLWGGVLKEMPLQLLKSRFQQQFGERAMHGDKVREVPVVLLNDKEIPLRGCALWCKHGG